MRPELSAVVESPLVQLATAAEAMPGSIELCYGDSDMPMAEFICRAVDAAARAGHTFYTHTAGAPELREAIAAKIRELQGVSYRPSEVMAHGRRDDGDSHHIARARWPGTTRSSSRRPTPSTRTASRCPTARRGWCQRGQTINRANP